MKRNFFVTAALAVLVSSCQLPSMSSCRTETGAFSGVVVMTSTSLDNNGMVCARKMRLDNGQEIVMDNYQDKNNVSLSECVVRGDSVARSERGGAITLFRNGVCLDTFGIERQ